MISSKIKSILKKEGLLKANFKFENDDFSFDLLRSNQLSGIKAFLSKHVKSFRILFTLFFLISVFIVIYLVLNPPVKEITKNTELINTEHLMRIIIYDNDPIKLKRYLQSYKYRDFQDEYGWSPLHWAVFSKNEAYVKILLEAGAQPSIRSKKNWAFIPAGITPKELAQKIHFSTSLIQK